MLTKSMRVDIPVWYLRFQSLDVFAINDQVSKNGIWWIFLVLAQLEIRPFFSVVSVTVCLCWAFGNSLHMQGCGYTCVAVRLCLDQACWLWLLTTCVVGFSYVLGMHFAAPCQVVFLIWHVYGICFNIKTDEWVMSNFPCFGLFLHQLQAAFSFAVSCS